MLCVCVCDGEGNLRIGLLAGYVQFLICGCACKCVSLWTCSFSCQKLTFKQKQTSGCISAVVCLFRKKRSGIRFETKVGAGLTL